MEENITKILIPSDDGLKNFIAFTATVSTIGQFFAGMFTVKKIRDSGTAGDNSPVPFLAGCVGCTLWGLYGVAIDDNSIKYVNVVGTLLNSFYVFMFLIYTIKKSTLMRQIGLCIIFFLAVSYYFTVKVTNPDDFKAQLGLVCTIWSMGSCASPLVALKHVIRTKSSETLPFPLIFAMFLVCLQWWIYGILIDDFYMKLTNCTGTLLATGQLLLFVLYPTKSSPSSKPYSLLVNRE